MAILGSAGERIMRSIEYGIKTWIVALIIAVGCFSTNLLAENARVVELHPDLDLLVKCKEPWENGDESGGGLPGVAGPNNACFDPVYELRHENKPVLFATDLRLLTGSKLLAKDVRRKANPAQPGNKESEVETAGWGFYNFSGERIRPETYFDITTYHGGLAIAIERIVEGDHTFDRIWALDEAGNPVGDLSKVPSLAEAMSASRNQPVLMFLFIPLNWSADSACKEIQATISGQEKPLGFFQLEKRVFVDYQRTARFDLRGTHLGDVTSEQITEMCGEPFF